MHAHGLGIAAGLAWVAAGVALASPPQQNSLGAQFRVLSQGASSVVEIRLQPKAAFDSVRVEAASGVASVTPCTFTAVTPGQSYSCQVSVSAQQGAPSLTLNLIGEKAVAADRPGIVEVSHFTLATATAPAAPAALRSDKSAPRTAPTALTAPDQPTPGLILTPPGTTPK